MVSADRRKGHGAKQTDLNALMQALAEVDPVNQQMDDSRKIHRKILGLALEQSEGQTRTFKGAAIVIKFAGSGEMYQPSPAYVAPARYIVGKVVTYKVPYTEPVDKLTVVQLRPTSTEDIEYYGVALDSLLPTQPSDFRREARRQRLLGEAPALHHHEEV